MKPSPFPLLTMFSLFVVFASQTDAQTLVLDTTYSTSSYEEAYALVLPPSGGYVVAGTSSPGGNSPGTAAITLFDSLLRFERRVSYYGAYSATGYSMKHTFDNGYVITGVTRSSDGVGGSDIYVLKVDAQGDPNWDTWYGTNYADVGRDVAQAQDLGYVVVGDKGDQSGGQDLWLVKFDLYGNFDWEKSYGDADLGRAICETGDGGFVVAGEVTSSPNTDAFVMGVSADGSRLWSKRLAPRTITNAAAVKRIPSGGYIVAGSATAWPNLDYDIYLMRFNETGDTLWTKIVELPGDQIPASVEIGVGGGFVVAGRNIRDSNSDLTDILIARFDDAGNMRWSRLIGGAKADYGYSVGVAKDTSYVVAGTSFSSSSGTADIMLCGVKDILSDVGPGVSAPNGFALGQNYPNPFNPSTTIKYELPKASVVRLSVYDLLGREVSVLVDERRDAGVHQVQFDASGLASGVYLYRLQAGDFVQTRRLVLIH